MECNNSIKRLLSCETYDRLFQLKPGVTQLTVSTPDMLSEERTDTCVKITYTICKNSVGEVHFIGTSKMIMSIRSMTNAIVDQICSEILPHVNEVEHIQFHNAIWMAENTKAYQKDFHSVMETEIDSGFHMSHLIAVMPDAIYTINSGNGTNRNTPIVYIKKGTEFTQVIAKPEDNWEYRETTPAKLADQARRMFMSDYVVHTVKF